MAAAAQPTGSNSKRRRISINNDNHNDHEHDQSPGTVHSHLARAQTQPQMQTDTPPLQEEEEDEAAAQMTRSLVRLIERRWAHDKARGKAEHAFTCRVRVKQSDGDEGERPFPPLSISS